MIEACVPELGRGDGLACVFGLEEPAELVALAIGVARGARRLEGQVEARGRQRDQADDGGELDRSRESRRPDLGDDLEHQVHPEDHQVLLVSLVPAEVGVASVTLTVRNGPEVGSPVAGSSTWCRTAPPCVHRRTVVLEVARPPDRRDTVSSCTPAGIRIVLRDRSTTMHFQPGTRCASSVKAGRSWSIAAKSVS